MSPQDLVTIATFATPTEAEVARLQLEFSGIRAVVTDVAMSGWFWYFGTATGGARLQVRQEDTAEANALIRSLGKASSDSASPESDWMCLACGAPVDAGFEVCWSCGAELGESRRAFAQPGSSFAEENTDEGDDPVDSDDLTLQPPSKCDVLARRAWRSAVLGTVFCPPLITFYSLAVMVRTVWAGSPLTSYARQRMVGAGTINVAMLLVVGIFLWMIFGANDYLFSTPWTSTGTALARQDIPFRDAVHHTFAPGQQWRYNPPGSSWASTVTVLAVQEVPSGGDTSEIVVLVTVETPGQSSAESPTSEVIPLLAITPEALSKSVDGPIANGVALPDFREEYARWTGRPLKPLRPSRPAESEDRQGGELPFSLSTQRTEAMVQVWLAPAVYHTNLSDAMRAWYNSHPIESPTSRE